MLPPDDADDGDALSSQSCRPLGISAGVPPIARISLIYLRRISLVCEEAAIWHASDVSTKLVSLAVHLATVAEDELVANFALLGTCLRSFYTWPQ